MFCQLGYIWIASRKSDLKDVVKLLWYVPDINDKEEKGVKINFRVSSLGNYVISEVIENNGHIERECQWRERKKRAQVSGLPVLTGDPRWRCSVHRTYRIRRKMIIKDPFTETRQWWLLNHTRSWLRRRWRGSPAKALGMFMVWGWGSDQERTSAVTSKSRWGQAAEEWRIRKEEKIAPFREIIDQLRSV